MPKSRNNRGSALSRRSTSRDVASLAGVSQSTVSRVLTGAAKVRPTTREAVLRALDELRYAPDATARAMRTRLTGTVGVLIPRITNPFYPELLVVLGDRLARSNRRMIVWESGVGDRAATDAIRQRVVDAIVLPAVTLISPPLLAAISGGVPAVLVNRSIPGLICDTVASDNIQGGASVAGYFLLNHHSEVAMIGGLPGTSTGDERRAGFAQELSNSGIKDADWPYIPGDFTYEHGFQTFAQLMTSSRPPDAVFCANDLIAFGALNAAKHLGIDIPLDVWIAGYDDVQMAAWPLFNLTTVRQPIVQMIETAVALAIERIEGNGVPPRSIRFPSELIIRGSTTVPS